MYVYKTEAFETSTIFHVSKILIIIIIIKLFETLNPMLCFSILNKKRREREREI